jgi:hypothetical protein
MALILRESIEHNEIHRSADKARVFGIVRESWQIRCELFKDFTLRDRLAPVNRILSQRLRVLGLPLLQIDSRLLACQLLQLRPQRRKLALPPNVELLLKPRLEFAL